MLKDGPLFAPDRIGTDGAAPYPPAISAARKDGLLPRIPLHYVTKHLQQGIESDHCRVKKNMPRIGGFQSFHTARRTIRGFEAMLWLRKGFDFAGAWRGESRTGCCRTVSVSRRLINPDSQMDWAGRTGGRGNAGETAGSFFHPSGPSEFGHLIQRKRLICRVKLVRGAGRAPFHPVNPGY